VVLEPYQAIGVVEFKSSAEGDIAKFTTQKFIEAITEDQKGVEIIDLGNEADILSEVDRKRLDPDALMEIGQKYNVRSVITGDLQISDIKPHINIELIIESASASADVEATLTSKMLSTGNGAIIWTSSSKEKERVGHVSIFSGHFSFDAKDPQDAYGELVESLVHDVTRDFRER